ncbi:chromate transporter [Azonexus sp.]|uniref:chromate transporter n=1 Tax=Azonexus sp. TaxID=1872668 RepID=UPI0027B966CD|nr:chromate transporter [Azonexus sp.]
MIVVELFLEFTLLSFVAFGGATALLPEMHRVVVEQHQWLNETTFTHLYAIAQAAPGPNVLVVTLIGWKIAGLAGALATTLAMCLPMSVVIYLLIDRWQGFAGQRWQRAISLGVAPLAVGLIFSGALLIAQSVGLAWGGALLVLIVVVLNLRTRWHPLWFIALGALAGLLGWV